jgi:hypothetical protein
MRLLLSALLGMLFLAAFIAFFLIGSVVGYIDSPDRLVKSASEGGLRDAIVEQTAEYIASEVAADPTLETMSVPELRSIIGTVITREWLEDSLILAHKALKSSVHGAEATAVLDLRGIKSALGTALSELKVRAESNCEALLGPEACSDAQASRVMVAAFETRALLAIEEVHDEIDLMQQLHGSQRDDAAEVQKGLESLETVRMLGLVVLIISLALFIAVNSRPFSRFAISTGILATLSSVIYLIAIAVSAGVATDEVAAQAKLEGDTAAAALGAKVATQLVGDAVMGATLPVTMVGIAGVVLIVLGFLASSRANAS